jgi:hypothetical protein
MDPSPHAAPAPARRARDRSRRAYKLVVAAVVLELVLMLPFIDHLVDTDPLLHFTQHGLIFVGGALLGFALRDVQSDPVPD